MLGPQLLVLALCIMLYRSLSLRSRFLPRPSTLRTCSCSKLHAKKIAASAETYETSLLSDLTLAKQDNLDDVYLEVIKKSKFYVSIGHVKSYKVNEFSKT